MKDINILLLLTPKKDLAYLDDSMSVRQSLEKMKAHSYTQIPVIAKESGEYIGMISEGDLLWYIVNNNKNLTELEDVNIKKLIRKDYHPSAKVNSKMSELLYLITKHNFVPVVDDRNILMGIVTRGSVIKELSGIENAD